MRRLGCSIIFSVVTLLLVKADDDWRRVDTEVTKGKSQPASWSRSTSLGNRVPFVPEDMAMPPPWLLPHQQPQIGFPAAQAQVRSFFDEDPIEWPPLASSKLVQPVQLASPKQTEPLRTSLQPPPSSNRFRPVASASTILPVQHTWTYDNERRSTPQQQPVQSWTPPDNRFNQQVAKLSQVAAKNLEQAFPASSAELNDPYRSSQVEETAKQRHQVAASKAPTATATAGRKSVSAFYDSSEYDDDQDGSIISTSRQDTNKPITYSKNEAAGTHNQDRPVQQQATASRRQQPSSARPRHPSGDEVQLELERTFDSAKTAPRSPVTQFRQRQPDENRQASRSSSGESVDKQHQQVAKSNQNSNQHVRKQQQQQRQPAERNPAESPQAERPTFSATTNLQSSHQEPLLDAGQNQRQFHETYPDPYDNWPQRQKPKHRNPYRPVEEVPESPIRSRNRPKSAAVPPLRHKVHSNQDDDDRHVPHHPRYPSDYDPPSSYEQDDPYGPYHHTTQRPHRPTRPEYDSYHNDPESHAEPEGNNNYDPSYEEPSREPERSPQDEPVEDVTIPPRRRPVPTQSPPFQATEQFNGPSDIAPNVDEDFNQPGPFNGPPGPFNGQPGPPPRPHHPPRRPNRPPPPHLQRPRESVVTQGLNTLKSLVGLQSGPPRPRHPPNGFGPNNRGRRPPPPYPGGDPFDNYGDLGRLDHGDPIEDEGDLAGLGSQEHGTSAASSIDIEHEPMEHRLNSEEDLAPLASSSTESSRTTSTKKPIRIPETQPTTAPPPPTTTAAPEEPKSTLFPPFNKRVRPSPPSASTTENKSNNGKDSGSGQLRITSYKQRIEAMKERARLREQQQAQPKSDSDPSLELSDVPTESVLSSSSTSTTIRPSTTRAKVPPRMSARKPVTSAPSVSSTTQSTSTQSVPSEAEKTEEETPFEQYKRRFKPKPAAQARRPVKDEEAAPSSAQQEEVPAGGKKNLFGKLANRRRIRQEQRQEEVVAEPPHNEEVVQPAVKGTTAPTVHRYNKDNKRRPGSSSRTTAAPVVEPLPDSDRDVVPAPTTTSDVPAPVTNTPKDDEEAPKIELISVASVDENGQHNEKNKEESSEDHSHIIHPESQPTFMDKPEDPQERPVITEEEDDQERFRHPFFAMANNDPILPIEELLNIRVRDNGKDM